MLRAPNRDNIAFGLIRTTPPLLLLLKLIKPGPLERLSRIPVSPPPISLISCLQHRSTDHLVFNWYVCDSCCLLLFITFCLPSVCEANPVARRGCFDGRPNT